MDGGAGGALAIAIAIAIAIATAVSKEGHSRSHHPAAACHDRFAIVAVVMSEVAPSRICHRCGSVGTARRIDDHAEGHLGVPVWEVEPVPG